MLWRGREQEAQDECGHGAWPHPVAEVREIFGHGPRNMKYNKVIGSAFNHSAGGAVTGPKIKSETDKERVLAEVGRLDRCGYSQYAIAEKMKTTIGYAVSQPMVSKYLKRIREEYKGRLIEDRSAKVAEMLDQLRDVRVAAWDAYERSKEDAERVVKEAVAAKEGGEKKKPRRGCSGETAEQSLVLLKQIVTTEGRLPGNAYLNTVLATLQAERDLLGLDAPKEVDVRQITTLNWDALCGFTDALPVVESNDPLEAKILEAAKCDDSEGGDLPAPIQ